MMLFENSDGAQARREFHPIRENDKNEYSRGQRKKLLRLFAVLSHRIRQIQKGFQHRFYDILKAPGDQTNSRFQYSGCDYDNQADEKRHENCVRHGKGANMEEGFGGYRNVHFEIFNLQFSIYNQLSIFNESMFENWVIENLLKIDH